MTDDQRHREFDAERDRRCGEVFEGHPGLLFDHRRDHPWLTGALGDPFTNVWFVAENPSLTQVERVIDASVESQWIRSRGDQLFRKMLVDHGFKAPPANAPGGWRCYITDVIKSADRAGRWADVPGPVQWETVKAWAPVLRWELAEGAPKLLVSVGKKADKYLTRLERQGLLPALPERMCIPHYTFVAMRPDRQRRPGGHPDREAEYAAQFAEIARRAEALGAGSRVQA